MIKSISAFCFTVLLLAAVGCMPKASDSDVGREKETDGFRVKTFYTVKISPVDLETAQMIKATMNQRGIRERLSVTQGDWERKVYYSSDEDESVEVKRYQRKTVSITLEGVKGFTDDITDHIQDKSTVKSLRLKNAKKGFTSNKDRVLTVAHTYIVKHGLEFDGSHEFQGEKTEEYVRAEKRIVMKNSPDYLVLIVEGYPGFVDKLRIELKELN